MAQMNLGKDAKLYYGTAGAIATVELTNVSDVTLNQEVGWAERRVRGSAGATGRPTIHVRSIDLSVPWDESDAGFLALYTAFSTGAQIALRCLAKSSGKGVSGDWYVVKCNRPEKIGDEEIVADITVRPAAAATNPVAFI